MDEQGFDFKPKERRDPKKFVPPPWELDAFEHLKRTDAEVVLSDGTAEAAVPIREHEAAAVLNSDTGALPKKPAVAEGKSIDESAMLEMLAGLAAEEPPVARDYFGVAVGAALVLFALGAMLLIWGMAALVGARQTGWMGQVSGAGLGMFGVFFFGMGVWLMYRTLKQRGVL